MVPRAVPGGLHELTLDPKPFVSKWGKSMPFSSLNDIQWHCNMSSPFLTLALVCSQALVQIHDKPDRTPVRCLRQLRESVGPARGELCIEHYILGCWRAG